MAAPQFESNEPPLISPICRTSPLNEGILTRRTTVFCPESETCALRVPGL
nr:MAG TPA: hypothetical protein [Caudoviricetes sp.]